MSLVSLQLTTVFELGPDLLDYLNPVLADLQIDFFPGEHSLELARPPELVLETHLDRVVKVELLEPVQRTVEKYDQRGALERARELQLQARSQLERVLALLRQLRSVPAENAPLSMRPRTACFGPGPGRPLP